MVNGLGSWFGKWSLVMGWATGFGNGLGLVVMLTADQWPTTRQAAQPFNLKPYSVRVFITNDQ